MTLPSRCFDTPADIDVRCPACGYSAIKDARRWPLTDVPETRDDSLEYFDVLGADDDCIFCPECTCEFNPGPGGIAAAARAQGMLF